MLPDRPETGYGYIRCEPVESGWRRFVEKPDAATAQRYLDEGGYYWNSGMFVVRASAWLKALGRFRPDILYATRSAWEGRSVDASFVRPDKALFAAIPGESVDYAVLEKCPGTSEFDIRMVPLSAGWSDLGAWDAVWQVSPKDDAGNAVRGDTLLSDCRDTLVHATSRLVGAIGLQDLVVVETPDAVLVADRSRSQEIKAIVGKLQRAERSEHTLHRQVHRPWGWYDSIDAGPRFQVKRIMVKPGASLSLQKHHHRAEHWIVVSGTAEVTNGEQVILLSENQSTYIPLGRSTAWPTRARCRWRSSRCSPAATSERTTSCASKTTTAAAEPLSIMILVTGGAGFIGSNFVLEWLAQSDEPVLNLDALTYAGNMENFAALDGDPRHVFVHGDICDRALLDRLLAEHRPRAVLHFAAESHVDRSIHGPAAFVRTNVEGTFTLLEAARAHWTGLPPAEREAFRFHHVSTDEVYGSLGPEDPAFTETHPYQPNSPYSASKAASDHLVRAWFHTYGLPVLTTNCSNNYGPFHFPEKLIPLMIVNALAGAARSTATG